MLNNDVILRELLSFYSQEFLLKKLDISAPTFTKLLKNSASATTEFKLRNFWGVHVSSNMKKMKMEDTIKAAKDHAIMLSTPDGPQLVNTVWIKKPRRLVNIKTLNHSLTCSEDHLVESTIGWVYAKDAEGLQLITTTGLEVAVVTPQDIQPVWDFEINHENHRYWAGTGISSHNSGKSFILSNIVKNAQAQGAFIMMLDSEHALDIGYLKKIGVDVSEDKFMYAGVTTFSDVVKVISEFITTYEKTYGRDNPDSPQVIIALDSIDMLITDSENDHFESGIQKGDQGQRAKQSKHMLRTIVSRIKRNPMSFILTHQVYPNTDLMNGQGLWIVNNAIRYSASQIMLVVPAKLKEGTEVIGVRMKVETYKSRFSKVGTKVEVEVPYTSGMNPYSGFLDMVEEMGVIKSSGAWKTLELPGKEPHKFQSKHLDADLVAEIMSHPKIVESENMALALMADESNYKEEQEQSEGE